MNSIIFLLFDIHAKSGCNNIKDKYIEQNNYHYLF